jgi:uncharacterized integral membrane protein
MSTQTIIIIIAVVAIIALLAVRAGGPRVTQIDRTVRKEKGVPEDRDDA